VATARLSARCLLDLRFLEVDVLARDGIIFLKNELFGRRTRVFLRDVEESGSSRRQQLDLLSYGLGHGSRLGKMRRDVGDGGRTIRAKFPVSRCTKCHRARDQGAPKAAGIGVVKRQLSIR
jgi:hypothetical protein